MIPRWSTTEYSTIVCSRVHVETDTPLSQSGTALKKVVISTLPSFGFCCCLVCGEARIDLNAFDLAIEVGRHVENRYSVSDCRHIGLKACPRVIIGYRDN